ncbi:flagellar hook-length control protein FliK [Halanaerobaculum tunisiense]
MGIGAQVTNLAQMDTAQASKQSSFSKGSQSAEKTSDSADGFLSSLQQKIDQATETEAEDNKLQKLLAKKEKGEELDQAAIEELVSLLQNLNSQLKNKLLANNQEINQELLQNLKQQLQQLNKHLAKSDGESKLLGQQLQIDKQQANWDSKQFNSQLKSLLQGLKKVDQKFTLGSQAQQDAAKLHKLLTKLDGQVVNLNKTSQQNDRSDRKLARQQVTKESPKKSTAKFKSSSKNLNQQLEQLKTSLRSELTSKEKAGTSDLQQKVKGESNLDLIVNNLKTAQTVNNKSKVVVNNQQVKFKDFLQQITEKSNLSAKKAGDKITLQLEPKSLGKLQIKLGLDNGTMTAKILTENSNVKDLLDGNLGQLKAALDQKDLQIEQLEVSVSHEEEKFNEQQFEDSDSNRQHKFDFEEETNEEFDLSLAEIEESDQLETEVLGREVKETQEELLASDDVDYVV